MNGAHNDIVEGLCRDRVRNNADEIRRTLANVAAGNPLASEPSRTRLVDRLMAKNGLTREESEATVVGIRAYARSSDAERAEVLTETSGQRIGPEAIWGQSIDFIGIAFLERGRRAAQAVARVAYKGGRGWGSGFMVAEGLFLTNNHVIPDDKAARDLCVEFDYELDIRDNPVGLTRFAFDADSFFVSDPVNGLDFTLIALGERITGSRDIPFYRYCPLSDASDKHALGEVVNIVQHPAGRYKEVVLRENRLVARGRYALHYVADTEPGSSGSPVFNNQWQPVALHHWGAPYRDVIDDAGQRVPRSVNEGIRISEVVKALREKAGQLNAAAQARLQRAFELWTRTASEDESYPEKPQPAPNVVSHGPRLNGDGSVSWTLPIEISIKAPPLSAEPALPPPPAPATTPAALPVPGSGGEAKKPSDDYSDRGGYEPGFIPGYLVPLPTLSDAMQAQAAENLEAKANDDPYELRYHHFSAVVNEKRKLAFFTACNIDGRRSKYINRNDGTIEPLDPANTDHGLMERLMLEGAEASEAWYRDRRLKIGAIAEQDVYGQQVVPGFPNTSSMGRTLRMFQRGHLVRRLDPAWGTNDAARLAEADTFHFVNCAPQVGFFNMGQAQAAPGTGGGKLWRAVENIVLRNARTTRSRICSFTGPIFTNKDRKFRTIRVPGRFFKIAVWADDDGLHSLAMIADQRPVIDVWPEALISGEALPESLPSEAFQDPDELSRVDDFLTTVEAVEADTGLDFGDAVRAADIRSGSEAARPETLDEVLLVRRSRNSRRSRTKKTNTVRGRRKTQSS